MKSDDLVGVSDRSRAHVETELRHRDRTMSESVACREGDAFEVGDAGRQGR